MATHFHLDYESRSTVPLDERGLHNYVTDPSTEIILAAYAEGDHKVRLWQPHLEPKPPAELREALEDPLVVCAAWNVSFERAMSRHVLGIDKPVSEWVDTMIQARYASLPGSLEAAGEILGLGSAQRKMEVGDRLVKLFCSPAVLGGQDTLFGVSETCYRDWASDPADWELFCEYNRQDVRAERAIHKKLSRFPLPADEQRNWEMDQLINERGIPTDLDLVRGAKFIADTEMVKLQAELKELTGLENCNSNEQVLAWVRERGYPFGSLGKAFVARAMAGEGELTDTARRVLEIRKYTSKSSVHKYSRILDTVGSDGRLRYQFSFMGASRTGRWSGKGAADSDASGVQMQNLSRPAKSVEKRLDLALELVRKMDYGGVLREFGQPLEVVSSVTRSSFCAQPRHKLVICDLSAIENRVAGWLSGCPAILRVFADGLDPYIDFATELYSKNYEDVTKEERTNSKPAVLGCGYGLGPGEEIENEKGDLIKTGLLGYAAALGVSTTQAEAERAVALFRAKYKEVPEFWYALEKASIACVRSGEPQTVGPVTFDMVGKRVLRILLPSGRYLHYIQPEVHKTEFTIRGQTFTKNVLSFMGVNQKTRQWERISTRGGSLFENLCQAIARDVLVHGMRLAEKSGMPVIAHVHDEIICEIPENLSGIERLIQCMSTPPDWAPDLPLAAAGFESKYYKKD